MAVTIALIHATRAAVSPVETAFAEAWPEAATVSLLAEDLTRDLAAAGEQTPAIRARIMALAEFAERAGVEGILFTGSAFTDAIEAVQHRLELPVLKPNEAMFEEAIEHGGRIGMLVTFEPAIRSMADEFTRMAEARGSAISLDVHFVPDALEALNGGHPDRHHDLLAKAAARLPGYDILLLAQFSMAGAKTHIEKTADTIVLSSPGSAIRKLAKIITP
ncbi:MAG: aspartate/glutamate racemase family protein [Rhodospirillales bacterium]